MAYLNGHHILLGGLHGFVEGEIDTQLADSGNAIANRAVKNAVDQLNEDVSEKTTLAAVINAIYPVGAIYMSVSSANPSTLFGGTWEQIQNTFLLAAGTAYAAGTTGGEATHTLTVDEIPAHNHSLKGDSAAGTADLAMMGAGAHSYTLVGASYSTGGGQAHNNLPPYLAVYVWKRTA